MATKKLQQSQLELQAGQAGESATQRSHESLVNTRHRNADRAESSRQFDSQVEQRNLDRYQRQWEQQRADRAQRDAQRAKNQAAKPRTTNFGNEGMDPNAPGDPQLEESKRQFDLSLGEKQRQFDTSTDLSAATHGLQRAGGPAGGNPGPDNPAGGGQVADNPRLQALQMEMANRQNQQMGAGIEQTGRRGFVPTPEAQQAQQRSAQMAEREMQTKEMNAAEKLQRAKTAFERLGIEAAAAKTAAARKELEAQRKVAEESLMQPIKSDSSRLNRFMKGEETLHDWQTLEAMLKKDVAPVGNARALWDELGAKTIGPRLTQFLGEKIAASAVEFIYATGKLPDGNLVDMSSAGMQEFSKAAIQARQMLLPQTVAGKMFTGDAEFDKKQVEKVKRGYPEHLEMVHKLGALIILRRQPTPPGMPHAGLSQPQEPQYEQRRADPTKPPTPAERYGQVTPAKAAADAEKFGGTAAPKTSKKPYKPEPKQPKPGVRGGLSGNLPYGV